MSERDAQVRFRVRPDGDPAKPLMADAGRRASTEMKKAERASEALNLRWKHVDWERRLAVLPDHKTARKTGRPRVIFFAPPVIKLLAWIRRSPRPGLVRTVGQRVIDLLKDGPRERRQITRILLAEGHHYSNISHARVKVGVRVRHVGPARVVWWSLPAGFAVSDPKDPDEAVFLDEDATPWSYYGFRWAWKRIRERAGLNARCVLYGLRHAFGTEGCRCGVNLKVLSVLMGHADTKTTEIYTHVEGDVATLHAGLGQIFGRRLVVSPADSPGGPPGRSEGRL